MPSSFRGCNWRDKRGRSAASKPSSTHRMRTRSTVERLTSRASAIASSLKRGPATPSSAFSRMRACVSVRAAAFPFDSSSPNCARSSDVNFTRYSFIGQHFTGTHPYLSAILPGRTSTPPHFYSGAGTRPPIDPAKRKRVAWWATPLVPVVESVLSDRVRSDNERLVQESGTTAP
jgi:hypothetical protein